MKVAITVLNMPDGSWHWVARIWPKGPAGAFEVHASQTRHKSATEAWQLAYEFVANTVQP